jgi:internalin A
VLLLKRTRISDISPLRGLRKLKHLYIEGSLVQDTSPVQGIPGLKVH